HAEMLQAAAPAGTPLIEITGAHADGHLTSGAVYVDPLNAFFDDCGLTRRPPDAIQTPVQRSV
ncbi:MAG: hypothetical protein AAFU65_17665, partial [Pseudomonadota bacterium]